MLSYSEEEEEDENDDDEEEDEESRNDFCGQTSPGLEEDDDDEEEDEEDEDDDDAEEEVIFSRGMNGGLRQRGKVGRGGDAGSQSGRKRPSQPSSSSTTPSPPSPPQGMGGGGRFSSSTPLAPVRSTGLYYRDGTTGARRPANATPIPRPTTTAPVTPTPTSSSPSFSYSNGGGAIVTQAAPPPPPHQRPQHRPPQQSRRAQAAAAAAASSSFFGGLFGRGTFSHWSASKLIVALASLFFLVLMAKYSSLRPSADIADRLRICGTPEHNSGTCVHKSDREGVAKLHRSLISCLEGHEQDVLCESKNATDPSTELGKSSSSSFPLDSPSALALKEVSARLRKEEGKESRGEAERLLPTLLRLLGENPTWGVRLHGPDGGPVAEGEEPSFLSLSLGSASVGWSCWMADRLGRALAMGAAAGEVLAYMGLAAGLVYAAVRLYRWRRDRDIRRKQVLRFFATKLSK